MIQFLLIVELAVVFVGAWALLALLAKSPNVCKVCGHVETDDRYFIHDWAAPNLCAPCAKSPAGVVTSTPTAPVGRGHR